MRYEMFFSSFNHFLKTLVYYVLYNEMPISLICGLFRLKIKSEISSKYSQKQSTVKSTISLQNTRLSFSLDPTRACNILSFNTSYFLILTRL